MLKKSKKISAPPFVHFIIGIDNPARAQYLLGHAKAQMTLDGYTHIRGGDMADIAQIVEKTMVVKPVVK